VMKSQLTTTNHRSDSAGLTYIYPVISRRTGGLSIGINFNTNNSCNWRCIYCQVPDLKIGVAPEIDFHLLEQELRFFLDQVLHGDFYDRFSIQHDSRVIKDIAIAGNGEPTTLKGFDRAVELIGRIGIETGVFPNSDFILITNGSLLHQVKVQAGLKRLNQFGGEVWFKLDSATEIGRRLINNSGQSGKSALQNLILASKLCSTKIQTCLFDYDKQGLLLAESNALLALLKTIMAETNVRKLMLYTLARPSFQPESVRIAKLPQEVLTDFADKIRLLGFDVSVGV